MFFQTKITFSFIVFCFIWIFLVDFRPSDGLRISSETIKSNEIKSAYGKGFVSLRQQVNATANITEDDFGREEVTAEELEDYRTLFSITIYIQTVLYIFVVMYGVTHLAIFEADARKRRIAPNNNPSQTTEETGEANVEQNIVT